MAIVMVDPAEELARPARAKKSRKIFDPADHDQPARKRKLSFLGPCNNSTPDSTTSNAKPLLPLAKSRAGPGPGRPSNSYSQPSSSSSFMTMPTLKKSSSMPSSSISSSSSSISLPSAPVSLPLSPQPQTLPLPKVMIPEICCIYCGIGGKKKEKGFETLLYCKDCTTVVHPSCMEYSPDLARRILLAPWQCISCKTCTLCQNGHDDEMMLICDSCDLGYHMTCHRPQVLEKPDGKWECLKCNPGAHRIPRPQHEAMTLNDEILLSSSSCSSSGLSSPTSSRSPVATFLHSGSSSGSHVRRSPGPAAFTSEENRRFLPLIPHQLHPATGLLPDNWEDYPVDPEIPDVAGWSSAEVADYFARQGFGEDIANKFVDEAVDGRALLLLHRQDVLSNLGLKLGYALKIFNHVKRLQTRRNFPA